MNMTTPSFMLPSNNWPIMFPVANAGLSSITNTMVKALRELAQNSYLFPSSSYASKTCPLNQIPFNNLVNLDQECPTRDSLAYLDPNALPLSAFLSLFHHDKTSKDQLSATVKMLNDWQIHSILTQNKQKNEDFSRENAVIDVSTQISRKQAHRFITNISTNEMIKMRSEVIQKMFLTLSKSEIHTLIARLSDAEVKEAIESGSWVYGPGNLLNADQKERYLQSLGLQNEKELEDGRDWLKRWLTGAFLLNDVSNHVHLYSDSFVSKVIDKLGLNCKIISHLSITQIGSYLNSHAETDVHHLLLNQIANAIRAMDSVIQGDGFHLAQLSDHPLYMLIDAEVKTRKMRKIKPLLPHWAKNISPERLKTYLETRPLIKASVDKRESDSLLFPLLNTIWQSIFR